MALTYPVSLSLSLTETYHMIDTCDSNVACWSDDGETFVVKDPVKFERTIIPQFFKHSKFSSFVRQLNFYSFRKIKYADTIRIDPKLEAETANYWRFRHENFQRGKPELLTEIKRMNGQKGANSSANPSTVTSSSTVTATNRKAEPAVTGEDKVIKSEVQVLKKRIEEMTKNIDDLTVLVQKVSLKQDEEVYPDTQDAEVGNKRKKLDARLDEIRPDDMLSGMGFEEMDIPAPALPLPMAMVPISSASSDTTPLTQISDNEFVDQLFTAFKEEEEEETFKLDAPLLPMETDEANYNHENHPDPELMQRLGDALGLLPLATQEMIVDRLIAAITSTDALDKVTCSPVAAAKQDVAVEPPVTVRSSSPTPLPDQAMADAAAAAEHQEATLPLAAATLAALLHHYTSQLQGKQGKSLAKMDKTIPVIPVHA
jgi:heat shock transcription factor 2